MTLRSLTTLALGSALTSARPLRATTPELERSLFGSAEMQLAIAQADELSKRPIFWPEAPPTKAVAELLESALKTAWGTQTGVPGLLWSGGSKLIEARLPARGELSALEHIFDELGCVRAGPEEPLACSGALTQYSGPLAGSTIADKRRVDEDGGKSKDAVFGSPHGLLVLKTVRSKDDQRRFLSLFGDESRQKDHMQPSLLCPSLALIELDGTKYIVSRNVLPFGSRHLDRGTMRKVDVKPHQLEGLLPASLLEPPADQAERIAATMDNGFALVLGCKAWTQAEPWFGGPAARMARRRAAHALSVLEAARTIDYSLLVFKVRLAPRAAGEGASVASGASEPADEGSRSSREAALRHEAMCETDDGAFIVAGIIDYLLEHTLGRKMEGLYKGKWKGEYQQSKFDKYAQKSAGLIFSCFFGLGFRPDGTVDDVDPPDRAARYAALDAVGAPYPAEYRASSGWSPVGAVGRDGTPLDRSFYVPEWMAAALKPLTLRHDAPVGLRDSLPQTLLAARELQGGAAGRRAPLNEETPI